MATLKFGAEEAGCSNLNDRQLACLKLGLSGFGVLSPFQELRDGERHQVETQINPETILVFISIFPQQRKLMGSSAHPACAGAGRRSRFWREVPEGSAGFRCVLV